MIRIKYIGKRERYAEGCYGSKIEFTRGQDRLVSDELAGKLLKHKDQYVEVKNTDENIEKAVEQVREIKEEPNQDALDSVIHLDKQGLLNFAEVNFSGFKLDKRISVEKMRNQVVQFIDQYGLD